MTTLFALLERKNLCYRSFYKICQEFMDEITRGDVSKLEIFQKRRQGLIQAMEKIEQDVKQHLEGCERTMTDAMKEKINAILNEKNSLVRSILDLDLQILGHIDRIKDDTIQRLQSLQTGRKTISAYKSPIESIESVENKKLDQEA